MEIKFDCVNILTTVADAPWIITSFIDELRRLILLHKDESPIVGVDVKLDPNSTSNLHYKAAATLQLCYRTHCIIIQLLHLDVVPPALKTFLLDKKIRFSRYDVSGCFGKLERSYGFYLNYDFDYSFTGTKDSIGLEQKVRTELGLNIEIPTTASSSVWGARNLTEEQIKYAAICAYAVAMLGVKKCRGAF
ncbi:uncharacterized protein LOC113324909 [Papaver somniferum]|uniref:uncharacterized protein LOC113324909 n=1 Tax=Papaver somniferum TaxID=3469 RepID=UPI000E6FA0CD|nr:uncharacterized protein LOC113324909 [Papaver somniferum]